MDMSLEGRRALVCGASQGIGRACAVELAGLGASVTLVSRSRERLEAARALLDTSRGQEHGVLVADLSDPDGARRAVEGAADSARPWTILVNNTGGPAHGVMHETDGGAFLDAVRAHVVGAHVLVQALLPGMKAARWGRVVNIISVGLKTPIAGLGVSNTTRGAVGGWAKTLAGELAPLGITVNNVLPGFTDTERLAELFESKAAASGRSVGDVLAETVAGIPAGRLGLPEEIGAAVAFLASPAAGYITGTNVVVDGGRTPCL